MKVVILAGGMGSRLQEETVVRPKPLVEIGGKPILWHILNIYSAFGFDEFVLALGYKAEAIKEYFLNFYALNNDLTVDLSEGKSKIHQGKHEPLITEQTFQKVRSILSGKSATKTTKRNFLFKGMMRCSECTGMITWEEHKGFIYGHCNHYRKCSQKVWSKQPLVESQLELAFRKLQLDNPRIAKWILKALKESHKDEINYHTSRQNELNQRLKRVQRRIETLYDDKLDSVIDAEFFENKNSKLLVEKENVLNDIEKLSNTNDEYYQDSIDIYKLSQNAFETYKKANVDAKRNLLRLVFGKMLLNEGKLVYNYSKPFELLQKAVGTTNSSKIPESEFLKMNIFEQPKKSETMAITQGIYPQSYLVRE